MSSSPAWSLLALLFLMVVVFAPIGSVYVWRLFRREHPISDDPRCGRCGYIVRGIASLTCPECGSDLREVGIRVGPQGSASPTWFAPLALGIGWTIGLLIMQSAAWPPIRGMFPRWAIAAQTITLENPGSKAYDGITISRRFSANLASSSRWTVDGDTSIAIVRDSVSSSMLVRSDLKFQDPSDLTRSGSEDFDAKALQSWMKRLNIPENSETSLEAHKVVSIMQIEVPSAGLGSFGSSSKSGTLFTHFGNASVRVNNAVVQNGWIEATPWLVIVPLWLGGLYLILRRFSPVARH